MMEARNGFRTVALAAAFLLLGACGGSGSNSATEGTGLLSLGVSDGPIHDAEKVCITFDSLEFKPKDGRSFVVNLDPATKVDLLDFQGANAAPLLTNEEVPAGEYAWVRLGVDASRGSNGGMGDTGGPGCDGEASYIVMNGGTTHNLFVPSGDQTGLKLVSGLTVPVNGSIDATAEWDLAKSVTAPPGLSPDVILKPTIRLVDNLEVGTLVGQVSADLATAPDCAPSVFVFDDGITPNAISSDTDDPNDPVATALVDEQMNNDGTTTFHYEIGFLTAGSYEAAFTCDGETFTPVDGKPAAINARATTAVDFP